MAYRPNSAGATRRASTATPSRFAASMTGRPIMVHRSPCADRRLRSRSDALSSVDAEPALDLCARCGFGGAARWAGQSGSPAASSSSVAGGSGSGDAGTNLRSEKGEASRILLVATRGWRRGNDDAVRQASGVGGGHDDGGRAPPVVPRPSANGVTGPRRLVYGRRRDDGRFSITCRDGSELRGVTYFPPADEQRSQPTARERAAGFSHFGHAVGAFRCTSPT